MLYIWPYLTFFSLPLIYPYVASTASSLIGRTSKAGRWLPTHLEPYRTSSPQRKPQHIAVAVLCLTAAMVTVHLNTIVHPFTLADNRHYVFYVFRVFILGHPISRYAVAPAYLVCGWLCIRTLGTPQARTPMPQTKKGSSESPKGSERDAKPSKTDDTISKKDLPSPSKPVFDQVETRAGFVLVWLATSALCVITAPLVEPRYYILTWILWRLHIPSPSSLQARASPSVHKAGVAESQRGGWRSALTAFQTDHRLWFETIWFMLVNTVTGYLFSYRGFEWPQEPHKTQRFIW